MATSYNGRLTSYSAGKLSLEEMEFVHLQNNKKVPEKYKWLFRVEF